MHIYLCWVHVLLYNNITKEFLVWQESTTPRAKPEVPLKLAQYPSSQKAIKRGLVLEKHQEHIPFPEGSNSYWAERIISYSPYIMVVSSNMFHRVSKGNEFIKIADMCDKSC